MAKIESSAVNDLIDLVARRPLARDSGDDLLFARPAHAANETNRPAPRPSPVRITAAPPMRPMPQLRLVPATAGAPQPVIRAAQNDIDETWAVTMRRRLQSATPRLVVKIAVLISLLVVTGIAIGHFAFRTTHKTKPAIAEPGVATPRLEAPAPEPAIAAAVAAPVMPTPKPIALVDVRIDSQPPGTTVTLIDNGKSTFLGTTPVEASVDPSRAYDVVFTRDGQPTHTEHFDPKVTQRLTIALDVAPPAPTLAMAKTEAPAAAAPKKSRHHAHAAKKPASKKSKKKHA